MDGRELSESWMLRANGSQTPPFHLEVPNSLFMLLESWMLQANESQTPPFYQNFPYILEFFNPLFPRTIYQKTEKFRKPATNITRYENMNYIYCLLDGKSAFPKLYFV